MCLFFTLVDLKIPIGGETVVKPAAKTENAAPEKKTEAEISKTSVGKADGEKSVPPSKAVVSLYFQA